METNELQFKLTKNTPVEDLRKQFNETGASTLSNAQLWALALRRPTQTGAEVHDLLCETNFSPDPADVEKIDGIAEAKNQQILSILEIARRIYMPANHRIRFPADVYPLVSHYADKEQEHFLVLSLNGAHEVIDKSVASVGLMNRALVHPREIFKRAITKNAAAIVMAHNHPSGNTQPSPEDHEVTKRIKDAGSILGITVLDHVIFSTSGYYSFLEHGEI